MSRFQKRRIERQRAAVVAEAESWLRTPYHHRANVKGGGVDCAWLLIEVFAATGMIERFDPGEYPLDWMMHRDDERYLGWVERHACEVLTPLPGDIAVWRFGRTFSHGAIVTEWPFVIHAHRRERMVVRGDATQGELGMRERRFYSLFGG